MSFVSPVVVLPLPSSVVRLLLQLSDPKIYNIPYFQFVAMTNYSKFSLNGAQEQIGGSEIRGAG